ncbi:MAG: hypothetical protein INR68_17315 [Methylobacterium mesophilicum]|nr:hypothetical protein [Methylobacterium mesophilicum]
MKGKTSYDRARFCAMSDSISALCGITAYMPIIARQRQGRERPEEKRAFAPIVSGFDVFQ